MQEFTAVFTVLRVLAPVKMSYEVPKNRAEPYTKIVREIPQMRGSARDGAGSLRDARQLENRYFSDASSDFTIALMSTINQAQKGFYRASLSITLNFKN